MHQPISQEANNTFFDGIYQEVWRKMIPAGLTEAEADFIEDVCKLQPGDAVLDIMCGYGRHTLELAKRGYALTAVDSAAAYIAEIKTKAVQEDYKVQALTANVAQTQFPGRYKAAICMGNSFAFFAEAGVLQLLENLSAALEPGALFVIDTWMIGEVAIRHFQEKTWNAVEGFKYLMDSRYCFHPTRIESDHIIVTPEGAVETLQGVDYIFTLAELERMLHQKGFRLQEVYSTPRKRRFQLGDRKAYITAERV